MKEIFVSFGRKTNLGAQAARNDKCVCLPIIFLLLLFFLPMMKLFDNISGLCPDDPLRGWGSFHPGNLKLQHLWRLLHGSYFAAYTKHFGVCKTDKLKGQYEAKKIDRKEAKEVCGCRYWQLEVEGWEATESQSCSDKQAIHMQSHLESDTVLTYFNDLFY